MEPNKEFRALYKTLALKKKLHVPTLTEEQADTVIEVIAHVLGMQKLNLEEKILLYTLLAKTNKQLLDFASSEIEFLKGTQYARTPSKSSK